MTLPQPHPGESKEHYVARAMLTREAHVLYDLGDRRAACVLAWPQYQAAQRAGRAPHPPAPMIEADAPTGDLHLITEDAEIEIAAAEAGEDGKKTPTFSMVAYNGGPMRVGGFFEPVIVDLKGLSIRSQSRPIRFNHSSDHGVGHTTEINIDANRLLARGVISRKTPAAQEIIDSAKSGFPWQASIGARADSIEELKPGATATVNGRQVTGPMLIARKSTLAEISFVDLGADDTTSAAVAAKHTSAREKDMDFEKWLKAKGFDIEQITDEQKATLKAAYDAEHQSQTPPEKKTSDEPKPVQAGGVDQTIENARREAERRQRINAAAQRVLTDRPDLHEQVGQIAEAAIAGSMTPEQFELETLRLSRTGYQPASRQDRRRDARVVEAALCITAGLEDIEKHFDEQTLNAADESFGGGLGLNELLLMAAQANGYRGHGASNLRQMLACAFDGGHTIEAAGFSNFDLPGIMSNVANKFLRMGFDNVENTWRMIAARRSVRDFKQITSYSLTGGFQYEKVGPTGELEHATAAEKSYTNQADTYGRMFAITRKDIINDDLGALTQVPQRLGRGGALKLNAVFWSVFMDNATFFSADNNNFKSGATTTLGIDALSTAEAAFVDQTDPDGYPLGVMPSILLVPNALNALASQLMRSTKIVTAGGSSKSKDPDGNPHAGKFTVARSAYLSNSEITGNSTKAWYLLANPRDMPVIEVAFLNGRERPVVESADADFNTLGIQVRGYHDFGVEKQEPRGGVKMKGEA